MPGEPGPVLCAHGNPNVLTADVPSSRLSQGCTGQHVRARQVFPPPDLPDALSSPYPRITGGSDGAGTRNAEYAEPLFLPEPLGSVDPGGAATTACGEWLHAGAIAAAAGATASAAVTIVSVAMRRAVAPAGEAGVAPGQGCGDDRRACLTGVSFCGVGPTPGPAIAGQAGPLCQPAL